MKGPLRPHILNPGTQLSTHSVTCQLARRYSHRPDYCYDHYTLYQHILLLQQLSLPPSSSPSKYVPSVYNDDPGDICYVFHQLNFSLPTFLADSFESHQIENVPARGSSDAFYCHFATSLCPFASSIACFRHLVVRKDLLLSLLNKPFMEFRFSPMNAVTCPSIVILLKLKAA